MLYRTCRKICNLDSINTFHRTVLTDDQCHFCFGLDICLALVLVLFIATTAQFDFSLVRLLSFRLLRRDRIV